jgi:hypothetical protein
VLATEQKTLVIDSTIYARKLLGLRQNGSSYRRNGRQISYSAGNGLECMSETPKNEVSATGFDTSIYRSHCLA